MTASPISEISERKRERGQDDHQLKRNVIAPVTRERRVRTFHDAPPLAGPLTFALAARGFSMVVLASHSPPSGTVLRRWSMKPRLRKKSCALSLTSAVS